MVFKFARKTTENKAKNYEQCLHKKEQHFVTMLPGFFRPIARNGCAMLTSCLVTPFPRVVCSNCCSFGRRRKLNMVSLVLSFFNIWSKLYLCVCYKGVVMLNPRWDRMSTPHLAKKLFALSKFHQFTCTTFSPLYWSALSYGSITPSSVLKGRGCCRFPSSSIGFSFFHFPSLSTLHSFNPSARQVFPVTPCMHDTGCVWKV